MIEDIIVDGKVDNPNISSLSIGGYQNIMEVANKWQVGGISIPLL